MLVFDPLHRLFRVHEFLVLFKTISNIDFFMKQSEIWTGVSRLGSSEFMNLVCIGKKAKNRL